MISHLRVAFSYPKEGELKYKICQDASGLWAVIAPTGQVAGLCPTRWDADNAARGLIAFAAFSRREVAA